VVRTSTLNYNSAYAFYLIDAGVLEVNNAQNCGDYPPRGATPTTFVHTLSTILMITLFLHLGVLWSKSMMDAMKLQVRAVLQLSITEIHHKSKMPFISPFFYF
jgi:hypothetical protein